MSTSGARFSKVPIVIGPEKLFAVCHVYIRDWDLKSLETLLRNKTIWKQTEGTGLWAKICTPITSNLDFKIRLRLCEVTVTFEKRAYVEEGKIPVAHR